MLMWLAQQLAVWESAFSVFDYITLRGILSAMTALIVSTLVGPAMIRGLRDMQIGQSVRTDGPQSHLSKAGTPTMGGALIIVAIASGTLLWGGPVQSILVGGVTDYSGFWCDWLG